MKKLSLLPIFTYVLIGTLIFLVSLLYGYEKIGYIRMLIFFSVCCGASILTAVFFRYSSSGWPDPPPHVLKELIELSKELKTAFFNTALMFFFAILIMSFVALCKRITLF